jgi:hypothetical protein
VTTKRKILWAAGGALVLAAAVAALFLVDIRMPASPKNGVPVMLDAGAPVRERQAALLLVRRELPPGAPSWTIEAFFRRHGLPFHYDARSERPAYYALSWVTVRRGVFGIDHVEHALAITIYVDSDGRMIRPAVRDAYTGP